MRSFLFLVFVALGVPCYAGLQNQYAGTLVGGQIDASSTNIPTAFGSAGATLLSGLSMKTHLLIASNCSSRLAVSIKTSTTDCSGGSWDATVPASGYITMDNVKINATVCVRSTTGSALVTCTVDASAW